MEGHNTEIFEAKAKAFGFETYVIDGHNLDEILSAYNAISSEQNHKPKLIIAKTLKGKGVSLIEDKENWHGKALSDQQLQDALDEIGEISDPNFIEKIKNLGPKSN